MKNPLTQHRRTAVVNYKGDDVQVRELSVAEFGKVYETDENLKKQTHAVTTMRLLMASVFIKNDAGEWEPGLNEENAGLIIKRYMIDKSPDDVRLVQAVLGLNTEPDRDEEDENEGKLSGSPEPPG